MREPDEGQDGERKASPRRAPCLTSLGLRLSLTGVLAVGAGASAQDAAPPVPEAAAGEACTSSEECASRLGYGNVCDDGRCRPYVSRTDVLGLLGLKDRSGPPPKPFQILPSLFPAIGYNPALGFLGGVYGGVGMYLGALADTTISNANVTALVTTERQVIVSLTSNVMTAGNQWELIGDWRYLLYNQPTYGLGTGPEASSSGEPLPGGKTAVAVTGSQPMDFDQFRFHELVLKRVAANMYVGGGYGLDHYAKIVDKDLDLASSPQRVTAAYAYAAHYGFDPSQYTVSGVTAAALYDSRDSTINPYRGYYGTLQLTVNPEFLGSSRSSTVVHAEFRTYVPMSVEVPRNVLAFWVYLDGVVDGALPYLALPATGWGPRQRNGRGYPQGRFRGPWEAYAEAEWRFQITNDGLFGGVLFANAESFSSPGFTSAGYVSPGVKVLEYLQPAAGLGLRILINRDSRTNLDLDVAFGQGFFGFWLNAGEYF